MYMADRKKTIDFESFLAQSETTAFIVIKNDTILYEKYLNGYTRDSINRSFSTAKSITSTLIGMAIEDGCIRSINDTIITYIPELKGHGIDTMTVKDLLLMNSGIEFTLLQRDTFLLFQPFL